MLRRVSVLLTLICLVIPSAAKDKFQRAGTIHLDREGEKWAAREICTRSPRGYQAYESLTGDWYKNNPYPKDTDPPEKRAAYYDAYVKASSEWVHELPENTELWLGRIAALRESRQGSAADVEVAGERLLQIYAKNPGMVVGPNFPLEVANLYATRGVRLDRLPDLVKRAVAELDAPSFFAPSDLFARPAADQQASAEYEEWETWSTISDVWLKAKDQARAREALTHVQTLADRAKPKDPQDPTSAVKQRDYLKRQETYWREMGDLARLEGRKIDADVHSRSFSKTKQRANDTANHSGNAATLAVSACQPCRVRSLLVRKAYNRNATAPIAMERASRSA